MYVYCTYMYCMYCMHAFIHVCMHISMCVIHCSHAPYVASWYLCSNLQSYLLDGPQAGVCMWVNDHYTPHA